MLNKFTPLYFKALLGMMLFSLALPVFASAQEQLAQFIKNRSFAEGQFSQVVISASGAVKQRGTGEFSFSRPGKFRWEVIRPYPLLLVSNGQTVTSYDKDMQHATQKPMGNAMDSTPVALLFGSKQVDKLFVLKDEGLRDGKQWLNVRPKDKETLFDFVRMGWKDGLPVDLEIHDSLGQVTKLELSHWSFDKARPADYYEFKAPAGVDLIQTQ